VTPFGCFTYSQSSVLLAAAGVRAAWYREITPGTPKEYAEYQQCDAAIPVASAVVLRPVPDADPLGPPPMLGPEGPPPDYTDTGYTCWGISSSGVGRTVRVLAGRPGLRFEDV
jgi:hypothetical protein